MNARRAVVRGVVVIAGAGLIAAAAIVAHPRGRATLRWVRGFRPLEDDGRVYVEDGAHAFGRRIAAALPDAIADVEQVHGGPFREPFRVYVCASHETFATRIGQSRDTPVRGIAFLRDVWISPLAFAFRGRDTHRESLRHELSHLHLGQTLGWWRRTREVPAWFEEGLADAVAGTGFERTTRAEAIVAIRSGRTLTPRDSGRLPVPGRSPDAGLSWPMFHAQSRLFVEHLRTHDRDAFDRLMRALSDGARFATAFEGAFHASPGDAWDAFVATFPRDETRDGGPT